MVTSSDDASSLSSSGSQSSVEDDLCLNELEQRYKDISSIVDHLYKVSVRIRGPGLRARPLKALTYRQVDPDTGVDLFEMYNKLDHLHVRCALDDARREANAPGNVHDGILDRLASAITSRRRQLAYSQRHHQKMATPSPDHIVNFATPQPRSAQLTSQMKDLPVQERPIQSGALSERPSRRSEPVTILSATEATAYLQARQDDAEEVKTEVSVATIAVDSKGVKVAIPPVPAHAQRKEFECPLCFAMCPAKFGRDRIWR